MNRTIGIISVLLAILAIGVYRPNPGTLPLCGSEDGAAEGQTYPCVWDAARQGNGRYSAYGTRYVLYLDGPCPATRPDTRCIDVREWH